MIWGPKQVQRRCGLTARAMALVLVECAAIYGAEPGAAGSAPRTAESTALPQKLQRLVPLHAPLEPPEPGDWLDAHQEPGQTFAQYRRSRPVRADGRRRVLYVQPLGEFTDTQRKIVALAGEYLGVFYQLPVRVNEALPLSQVPANARRQLPGQDEQILTGHLLSQVLRPRLSRDAMALIGLTASDLWPGEGWNFVFGQASLSERVGVWSLARFGDPDRDEATFRLALRRTLQVASHETGHMFSMQHCVFYRCSMCGSNSLAESDRQPLWLCPQCLAKLCYATGAKPEQRFRALIAFAQKHQLTEEAAFWQKSLTAIESP